MTKRELIFLGVGSGIGSIVGFLIGYKALDKKCHEEYKKQLDEAMKQCSNWQTPPEESNDDSKGEDEDSYEPTKDDVEAYKQAVADTEPMEDIEEEDDISEIEEDDGEDNIELVLEEADLTRKKHREPKMLGKDRVDSKDPNTEYEAQDLYYYMKSDMLVNEFGELMDEDDTIGKLPRRTGFLAGNGGRDTIWIRNYDREIDYELTRKDCYVTDEFDYPEDDDSEEDNEETEEQDE